MIRRKRVRRPWTAQQKTQIPELGPQRLHRRPVRIEVCKLYEVHDSEAVARHRGGLELLRTYHGPKALPDTRTQSRKQRLSRLTTPVLFAQRRHILASGNGL